MYPICQNTHLVQFLQDCTENSCPAASSSYLEFPMEEFLYSVLADQIELRTSFYSLEYLPKLIEKYHEQHPDCTLTAEKLLSKGWLSPFLDRWDFSIWPHLDDLEERTIPDERREYDDLPTRPSAPRQKRKIAMQRKFLWMSSKGG